MTDGSEISSPLEAEKLVEVSASRPIGRSAETTYELLRDLRRHWPMLGSDLIRARILEGSDDERAELIVGGPVPGLRRRVVTEVSRTDPPRLFEGQATADSTKALITWRIDPVDELNCLVTLTATVAPGGIRDRLLVAAVGPWLDGRCRQVLERLEQELMK
ncbi:MAG: SRPBCC family protein [Solirubrobacterales bacterium]